MKKVNQDIEYYSESAHVSNELKAIARNVRNSERISLEEAERLYSADLGFLGSLASYIRKKRFGNLTYFNRNFHIEPTNICVFDCKFCSYSRLLKEKNEGWEHTAEEMLEIHYFCNHLNLANLSFLSFQSALHHRQYYRRFQCLL